MTFKTLHRWQHNYYKETQNFALQTPIGIENYTKQKNAYTDALSEPDSFYSTF